ncbi:TIGR00304 family protein [Methanosalsum natronophilum]|uniref:TIGR00304 family protein n=1 Tax=Methanosalsum natronophilum TaxID=768733 RepID=A0A3R7VU02_9EURY|nr:MAG: TIGR00304 family protein [Methanosalsum natronophilum]
MSMGMGNSIIIAGTVLIVMGILLLFISIVRRSGDDPSKKYSNNYNYHSHYTPNSENVDHDDNNRHSNVRGGGVVMIGPIPIIFGSDNQSAKVMMILAIILMLIALAIMYLI